MKGPSFIPPVPQPNQALALVEQALAEAVVDSPATAPSSVATGGIPGVGLMPSLGHVFMPTPYGAPPTLTNYLFAR